MSEVFAQTSGYTQDDYHNLPETVRAELIGGHISVICDPGKLTERGRTGAPDWIIERFDEDAFLIVQG